MIIFLKTERLLLRRFIADDVENLVELDSDPEVMRFINGGNATSREQIRDDFLPHFLAYYDKSERYGFWAAIEKSSGAFLGWFHFRPPFGSTDPDVAELGYRLRKEAWGKGYATEGSRALIQKGFTELGVKRVTAMTYEKHEASRKVMVKSGLTLARIFRPTREELQAAGADPDDIWEGNDVEYALDKLDWERQQTDTLKA